MATKSMLAFDFIILLSFILMISCHSSPVALPDALATPKSSLVKNNMNLVKIIDKVEHACANFSFFEDCINVVKNDTSMTNEDRCDFLKTLFEILQFKAKEIYSIIEEQLPKETNPWSKECLHACYIEYMMVQKYIEGAMGQIDQENYKKVSVDMKTIGLLASECQEHFDNPPGSPFGFGRIQNSPFKEKNHYVKILALTAVSIAA